MMNLMFSIPPMKKLGESQMTTIMNARGVSIIAAIFIIVVLAFMGVMFLSMVSTSTFTSVNDAQSTQALYVAEGGVEYAQYALAQNLEWYRSPSDPMPAPASTTLNLGAGSFTVYAYLPATMMRTMLTAGGGTANVYTTQRFPASGYLQIDNIEGSPEFVSYNATTSNSFTLNGRNQTIGSVSANVSTSHSRGSVVYPVSQLQTALPGNCNSLSIRITDHGKFLSAGTIMVTSNCTIDACLPANSEQITYANSSRFGGVMTLIGVKRCQNGTNFVAALVNDPVTPIQENITANIWDYEAEIISTGTATAGGAQRAVKKTIQR